MLDLIEQTVGKPEIDDEQDDADAQEKIPSEKPHQSKKEKIESAVVQQTFYGRFHDRAISVMPCIYGRSASGTMTFPCAVWYVSSRATSTRAVATPLPFSVWTKRGFSAFDGR